MNYHLTLFELEETDETCHGNWIKIQRLYTRIDAFCSKSQELLFLTNYLNKCPSKIGADVFITSAPYKRPSNHPLTRDQQKV